MADSDIQVVEQKLLYGVNIVQDWCIGNDMVVSVEKSKAMLISTRQRRVRNTDKTGLEIKIGDSGVPFVESCKVLGVHIDQYLTWEKHIKQMCLKIVRALYLFSQVKKFLPMDAKKLFYNCYILPYFDYCCLIWGNCNKKLMYELSKLQKRAARLIFDTTVRSRTKPMFVELKWLPVDLRIEYVTAVEMYKCINGMCPSTIQDMFEFKKNRYQHVTRSAAQNDVYIPKCYMKSFSYRGASIWNSVPLNIRSAPELAYFKYQCLKHYHARYIAKRSM